MSKKCFLSLVIFTIGVFVGMWVYWNSVEGARQIEIYHLIIDQGDKKEISRLRNYRFTAVVEADVKCHDGRCKIIALRKKEGGRHDESDSSR